MVEAVLQHASEENPTATPAAARVQVVTRDAVLAAREELETGATTMAAIGDRIGVTRERVRQLTVALGIKPKRPPLLCADCGGPRISRPGRDARLCDACRPRKKPNVYEAYCTWCGQHYVKTGRAASAARRYAKHGHRPTCPGCFTAHEHTHQPRGGMLPAERAEYMRVQQRRYYREHREYYLAKARAQYHRLKTAGAVT